MKKILIAEDDPDILYILNTILNNAGYEVESLPQGTSLVNDRREWPDLFILDKDMPVIDGLALCKYLKLKKETKDIPIIIISGYHKLKSRAQQAGADDFIEKPFTGKTLLNAVERHFKITDSSPI